MTALRSTKVLVMAALTMVLALVVTMPGFSTAAFTSQTTNSVSTVRGAQDWIAPTVSIDPFASSVSGAVSVTGRATDAGSGVKEIVVQVQPVDGSGWWTELCRASTPTFACAWDTAAAGFGAGTYTIRATATDHAGNETDPATTVSATVVESTQSRLTLNDPGPFRNGTVSLVADLSGWLSFYTIEIEYRALPNGSFRTLATGGQVFNQVWHSWDTSKLNGRYEVRAVARRFLSPTYESPTYTVMIDNTAPTITVNNPGSPLSGVRTFSATASDAHSGVETVLIQARASSPGSQWVDLCTATSSPWACSYDTRLLRNTSYSLRAIATDRAGNSTTSTQNVGFTVANQGGGGSSTGSTLTDATTARSAPKAPELPAVVEPAPAPVEQAPAKDAPVENAPEEPTDAPVDQPVPADPDPTEPTQPVPPVDPAPVDPQPVAISDLQVTHGDDDTAITPGDTIAVTYDGELELPTVLPGWSGEAKAVTLRVRDGNLLEVLVDGAPVDLGEIVLPGADLVPGPDTVLLATMSADTVMVGEVACTVITLKLAPAEGEGS